MRETWEIRKDTIMSIAWETDENSNIRLSLDSWNMNSNTELAQCTDLSQIQQCKYCLLFNIKLKNKNSIQKVSSYNQLFFAPMCPFLTLINFFSLRHIQTLYQKQYADNVQLVQEIGQVSMGS